MGDLEQLHPFPIMGMQLNSKMAVKCNIITDLDSC